jgi:hypothetical protein
MVRKIRVGSIWEGFRRVPSGVNRSAIERACRSEVAISSRELYVRNQVTDPAALRVPHYPNTRKPGSGEVSATRYSQEDSRKTESLARSRIGRTSVEHREKSRTVARD